MSNVHIVEMLDRLSDFPDEPDSLELIELLCFGHVVEEGASLHVLEDEVDVDFVADPAVELDDVGVADEGVQLHLLDELIHHVQLLGLRFDYLFDGADEASGGVST